MYILESVRKFCFDFGYDQFWLKIKILGALNILLCNIVTKTFLSLFKYLFELVMHATEHYFVSRRCKNMIKTTVKNNLYVNNDTNNELF